MPFIGPAGKLLTDIVEDALQEAGATQLRLAWTNLVACIPKEENSTRKRGEPVKAEIDACHQRLMEFLDIAKPKLVIAVGDLAKGQAVAHGWSTKWRVLPIVHPAFLIRLEVHNRGLSIQRVIVQLANAFAELVDEDSKHGRGRVVQKS
mgnify:CR=1 FL=1